MTAPVVEPGRSTIRGGQGGAVLVGRHAQSFPEMTKVSWYSDPSTGQVLALLLTPDQRLHVICEDGEIVGIPEAALQLFTKQYFVT